jgi:hypothetical protein
VVIWYIFPILVRLDQEKSGNPESLLSLEAGLPDGLFSNQKSQFGKISEDLRFYNVDIFYGHLEFIKDIRDFL